MASDPRQCSPKRLTPRTQVRKMSPCLLLQCLDSNQNLILLLEDARSKEREQRCMKSCQQNAADIFVFHPRPWWCHRLLLSSCGWAPGSQSGRDRKKTEMADFGGRWDEGLKTPFISPKAGAGSPRKLDQFDSKILQSGKKQKKSSQQIRPFFPEQIPQIS